MAGIRSSGASACLALHSCEVSPRGRGWNTVLSASAHRRSLVGLTMKVSGMNNDFPIKGTTQIPAVGPGPGNPSGGNLPIPNMPSWAKWVVGAVVVAIPIYRRMRTLEDKIEKTAEVAVEVVDTVAEATEKVAVEVADAFPGNEDLKEAAAKIKTVTDAIEEDAEKAEALIHKHCQQHLNDGSRRHLHDASDGRRLLLEPEMTETPTAPNPNSSDGE